MGEVLAASATIAGLLNLTITTLQLSHGYFPGVKNFTKTIERYFSELEQLKDVLEDYKALTDSGDTADFVSFFDTSQSEACWKELEHVRTKLEKQCHGSSFSKALSRLRWPFSEEEVSRTVEALHRHQSSLHRRLSARNLRVSSRVLSEVRHLREEQQKLSAKVSYDWLSDVNPEMNHLSARSKHSQGTGQWFLDSSAFKSWWNCSCRSLWVNAIPGAGKTVLCSTIIDYILHHQLPDEAVAYFYFDFSDPSKQKLNACLRSLLAQICSIRSSMPPVVAELKTLCKGPGRNGILTEHELLSALVSVCSGLGRFWIVIDALDESTDWLATMEAIKAMTASTNISLLTTSRREKEIEEVLFKAMDVSFTLNSINVDKDIGTYVVKCLQTDSELGKRPPNVKKRIEGVLTTKSQGMFRWVVCQIDVLRSCLTSKAVEEALDSLPQTLDASYERLLLRIHPAQICLARAALEFLVFSKRPPTLVEVAEAVAVGTFDGPFDMENRLFEPEEILRICSSLLVLERFIADKVGQDDSSDAEDQQNKDTNERPAVVRLAHYTVSEYLMSPRIHTGPVKIFALAQESGDTSLAKICLKYLLLFNSPEPLSAAVDSEFPLVRYAASSWYHHVASVFMQTDPVIVELLRKFYRNEDYYFFNSIRFSDPDVFWWGKPHPGLQPADLPSPLYYLCMRGACSEHVRLVIDMDFDVNRHGGNWGFPLQAACQSKCDITTLNILLESAANVNALGGYYHTALNAAAGAGSEDKVERLLNAGADPNLGASEGHFNALHRAIWLLQYKRDVEPYTNIVRKLLRAGVHVNTADSLGRTPLEVAARAGNVETVRALLQAGADVNLTGRFPEGALTKGVKSGSTEIVDCLLEAGAHINTNGYSTALRTAMRVGNIEMIQRLLKAGAEINSVGAFHTGPVHQAAEKGEIEILNVLLDAGADVTLKGWFGKTPLEIAASEGHAAVVRRLLQEGPEINSICDNYNHNDYDNRGALHYAAEKDDVEILNLLLDAGADVNLKSRFGRTAIRVAACHGHIAAVRKLLQAGADVNISDDFRRTPLMDAAGKGWIEVVDCLLEAGANPDIEAEWESGSASEAGPDPDPDGEEEWEYKSTSEAWADSGLDLVRDYSTFEAALRNGRPDIYKFLISAPPIWKDIKRSVSERRKAAGRRFQGRRYASCDDMHTQMGNSDVVSRHTLEEVNNRDG